MLHYEVATQKDLEPIYRLSKELIDAYEDRSQVDYPAVLRWVHQKIEENINLYQCIQQDGKTVGYLFVHIQEGKLELDDLYLLPEHRGQGIGSKVIEDCIGIAREREVPIFLFVFQQNTRAIELYKRFGFSITATVRNSRYIMERSTQEEKPQEMEPKKL